MPVRQLVPERTNDHATLVDELAREWEQAQSDNVEPVILIESDKQGAPLHVYVVWSKWRDIERVQRSEIVMDAAQRALSPEQVGAIIFAMGLTPDEADRLALKWR